MDFIKQNRLLVSLLLFIILFIVLWPFYKYIFDVDGIGYASVAHHYLNGDWDKAVNGFWYPLHSWLVIPLLKMGLSDGAAFKISNLLISIGSLITLHILLYKTDLSELLKTCIQLISIVLLLHYSYNELAGDILFMFIMLLLINLQQTADFYTNTHKNLLAGLLGACLYLSKSYGFPLFVIFYLTSHILFSPNKKFSKYMVTGLLPFFILSFLWMTALHWKYNTWFIDFAKYQAHLADRSSYSGTIIQPPPYNTSAAVWEDPWLVNSYQLPQKSLWLWIIQEVRVVIFNIQKLFFKLCDLSFLAPAILFALGTSLFLKNQQQRKYWFFLIVTIPLGYILLHVETRFIWILSFIFLIAGSSFLQQWFQHNILTKKQQLFLWCLFFMSFLLGPIDNLKDDFNRHREFYKMTEYIKKNKLSGNFTSNTKSDENMVLAYLSGLRYFKISGNPTADQLLAKFNEFQMKYYFFYSNNTFEKELFMNGPVAKAARNSFAVNQELIVFEF